MQYRRVDGTVAVCVERMVAILALTAFHDVMKVEALLPRVDAAHAPEGYLGYQVTRLRSHAV